MKIKTNTSLIENLYTGLLIWEGSDINPNGDPDNEGAPRVDPESQHGIISSQAIGSRVCRRVAAMFDYEAPYDIQIRRGQTIESGILLAAKDGEVDLSKDLDLKGKTSITQLVCQRFFDTRMKGGVLAVGSSPVENVNGVITHGMGRSVYPVQIHEMGLTRACAANEKQDKEREMGKSYKVAHAVYRQPFFVNPHHAKQNGATMLDLSIYLDSLINAYEFSRSGMSGMVNLRGLWLFKHDSKFGNSPAHLLLDRVQISSPAGEMARSWAEYDMRFDASGLPAAITVYTLEQLLGGHEAILKTLTE